MDINQYSFSKDLEINRVIGHKISCHDRSNCVPCFPYWKNDIRQPSELYWTNEISTECMLDIECRARLEYAYDHLTDHKRLAGLQQDDSLFTSKKGKSSDGLYHLFITLTPNPSHDTNSIMMDRAKRLANRSGVKQYLYCYEYMQNVKIIHVHMYLIVDNLKHFGKSEILAFNNNARVDVQRVASRAAVEKYISKDITKPDDLGGMPCVVKSDSWGHN